MARKTCIIKNCNTPAVGRGLCNKHWLRQKAHGNPETILVAEKGMPDKFVEKAVKYKKDKCLFWPYARDTGGYPILGKKSAHRVICERVYGKPPSGYIVVRHSCGNGHLGCVTPAHMCWGTSKQNAEDSIKHKGAFHTAKLTPDSVLEIRGLIGIMSNRQIAKQFSVSHETVNRIQHRKDWSWL